VVKTKTQRAYTARPNSPISDVQAEMIGREIEAMETEGVAVTAPNFVERAKAETSPLHGLFVWDLETAAQAHWISWARTLIASVQVIELRIGAPAKAFYSVVVETADQGTARRYKRRSVLDTSERGQVSLALYQRVLAAVKDAESFGLTVEDQKWSRIAAAVRQNPPEALALRESA